MTGKCPQCKHVMEKAVVTPIGFGTIATGEPSWRGLAYLCPHCQTILSVQTDLKAQAVDSTKPDDDTSLSAWLARDDDLKG